MVNFVICVLISLNGLLESILTSLKLEHEKSEQFSAFHTISVIPLQPENAFSPMFVTLFGIVTEVRPLQSEYLEVIDYQLFVVNTVEKWIGCYLWVYGK